MILTGILIAVLFSAIFVVLSKLSEMTDLYMLIIAIAVFVLLLVINAIMAVSYGFTMVAFSVIVPLAEVVKKEIEYRKYRNRC